jgi:hypothetical protein
MDDFFIEIGYVFSVVIYDFISNIIMICCRLCHLCNFFGFWLCMTAWVLVLYEILDQIALKFQPFILCYLSSNHLSFMSIFSNLTTWHRWLILILSLTRLSFHGEFSRCGFYNWERRCMGFDFFSKVLFDMFITLYGFIFARKKQMRWLYVVGIDPISIQWGDLTNMTVLVK